MRRQAEERSSMAELTDRYQISDRRLAAQFAVTSALAESSTLSEATPKLLQYICEAVGFELGELWCVNTESNTLHIEGSWHVPAYEVEEFEKAGRKTILFPASILLDEYCRADSLNGSTMLSTIQIFLARP